MHVENFQEAAVDHQLHRTMRFRLVVNCTNNMPFIHPRAAHTTYLKEAIEDNLRHKEILKMAVALPVVVRLIHDAICMNGAVLVHCRMGQQRSATFIAACGQSYVCESH